MAQTLKEITKTLTELKTNNLKAIKQVEAEIDKAKAQLAQAEAQKADDLKAYEKASKTKTALEFWENKLDKLNEPLVSTEEAMDIKAEIEDIFDSNNKDYFKKAYSLVKELNDLKEESLSDINEANAVLEILYYDVLKNARTWTLGSNTDIAHHKDVYGRYFNTIGSSNFIQAVLKEGEDSND